MKLTVRQIETLQPKEKPYKIFDGGGLCIEVTPQGRKRWRYRYRFNGKNQQMSLGLYPQVSLKEVREKHQEARKLLDEGQNPNILNQKKKPEDEVHTHFEVVARQWWEKNQHIWSEIHRFQVLRRLEKNIFPLLGKRDIGTIKAQELLEALRLIENREAYEMAHRVRSNCGQVFRYAIALGLAERDIAHDLRDALTPVKKQHFATLTKIDDIRSLLLSIDEYSGDYKTRCALQLAPLVFVRPGELRKAEWSEFDFEKREWRIPAEKMKARRLHIVPLSRQALHIIEELQRFTINSPYLFPSLKSNTRPMSDGALLSALRRMGYSREEMTVHGFRSMASTLLNEQGYNRDWIERQLAHVEGNSVRAAYNYAGYLPDRARMMQEWADFLDTLKESEYGGS